MAGSILQINGNYWYSIEHGQENTTNSKQVANKTTHTQAMRHASEAACKALYNWNVVSS